MQATSRMPTLLFMAALVLGSVGPVGAQEGQAMPGVINTKCRRSTDLRGSLAKMTVGLGFKNKGKEPVSDYYFALPKALADNLVSMNITGAGKKPMEFVPAPGVDGGGGAVHYKVLLGAPVPPKSDAVDLQVYMMFTNVMTPKPPAVAQGERQLVVFRESHYWLTPYPTTVMYSEVLVAGDVEEYSKQDPTEKKGKTIIYGPYNDVPAYAYSPSMVHFAHDRAFVTATSSSRQITVSPWWSEVRVREDVFVRHSGAALKGAFNRAEYQTKPKTSARSAAASLTALLPREAKGFYYRDDLGNVSTSFVTKNAAHSVMTLRPRYPLFGGWTASFTVGYTLPLSAAASFSEGRFRLSLPLGVSLEDVAADLHSVSVTLPEGAHDIKVEALPKGYEEARSASRAFLDLAPRTTLTLSARGVPPGGWRCRTRWGRRSMWANPSRA